MAASAGPLLRRTPATGSELGPQSPDGAGLEHVEVHEVGKGGHRPDDDGDGRFGVTSMRAAKQRNVSQSFVPRFGYSLYESRKRAYAQM